MTVGAVHALVSHQGLEVSDKVGTSGTRDSQMPHNSYGRDKAQPQNSSQMRSEDHSAAGAGLRGPANARDAEVAVELYGQRNPMTFPRLVDGI